LIQWCEEADVEELLEEQIDEEEVEELFAVVTD